jgi:hypothetical protein
MQQAGLSGILIFATKALKAPEYGVESLCSGAFAFHAVELLLLNLYS